MASPEVNTTAFDLQRTWADADNTPRVDEPRLKYGVDFVHDPPRNRPIPSGHPQHTRTNHAARYRALRKEKLNAEDSKLHK